MAMRESIYFNYANVNSFDKGLINVSISSGLYEEDVAGSRSINEDQDISGNRYLKNIENEPIEIRVSFYYEFGFDDDKVRDAARWLLQQKYQPLIFNEQPQKIYYAVPVGSYKLIHNGLKQGYLELTFRCNTYHAYSPVYRSEWYDLSINPIDGTIINFENNGDMDVQPKLYVKKIGAGNLSFTNLSDEGKTMTIDNLTDNEEIIIDCNESDIITESANNPYNNFNFQWLNLTYGINRIKVTGNCTFYYTCQFKIY